MYIFIWHVTNLTQEFLLTNQADVEININRPALVVQGIACLPLDQKVAGSDPAQSIGINDSENRINTIY